MTAAVGFKKRAGERVKTRRVERGMGQADLAAAARTTQQTVSRIEAGTVNPRDDIKVRVAAALEVAVSDLWTYEGE